MLIWVDYDMSYEFRYELPALSDHSGEREVLNTRGTQVGTDRWGYLSTGHRWRLVTFPSGDAVGYRPVSPKEASLFDQIISSACVSPYVRRGSVE